MAGEPLGRKTCHLFKGAGFFEEMAGARDDHQLLFPRNQIVSLLVKIDDQKVVPAHDQQGGRCDAGQERPRQIGPSTARYDRAPIAGPNSAAAWRAAAAPVLAPK